ncbi:hypothetical protein BJF90_29045 [Pseudonocardia sp. CNS-004]|nr:hypothetical protein BJF90_29045 [Pseudonocardia sp. CNS-004]
MPERLSLMEFLQALLTDAGLRGDFGDDPQGTLAAHGLGDLTPADVHDALVLVQDIQTVDYSLDAATAPPPPPPAGDDHEAAVEYLARYLAGPQDTGPAEQWADPDRSLDTAPLDGFGTGDDTGYGAGSDAPADDGGPGGFDLAADPAPAGAYDIGHLDDLGHDFGHGDFGRIEDLAEFTGVPDLPDDVPGGATTGPLRPTGLDGPVQGPHPRTSTRVPDPRTGAHPRLWTIPDGPDGSSP